jgi:2-polyprenyl-6-methoxyphenol hydroxylase-like FAD-dependent oxidoreductase
MNVLVIGEGPAGLTAALIAARDGHQVTLVKRRGQYTREQILFLNSFSIEIFCNLNVFEKLKIASFDMCGQRRGLIKIKKLERKLSKKLQEFPVRILHGKFTHFDNGKAVISSDASEVEIVYDILIGADGAKSEVRKTLGIKCNKIGSKVYVSSSFNSEKKVNEACMIEKEENSNFWIRKVDTPHGQFLLLHGKSKTEKADKHIMAETCRFFGWEAEAKGIFSEQATNLEIVPVRLKQAQKFSDEQAKVILVGDATTTGSFYLGRGVNLAIKNAEIVGEFLQMQKEQVPFAYDWYQREVKKISDDLLEGNKYLFSSSIDKTISKKPLAT